VGVAQLTPGSRFCSWARDRGRCIARLKSRFPPFPFRGPTTTTLTTRDLCPGGSGVWACPKFVRPPEVRGLNDGNISWDLKLVSPETQATNGHFQNYQKWFMFNENYQNRRTSIFWLLVLLTKIDTACFQMFGSGWGTNDAGCWLHDGDHAVSNTE